MDHSQALAITQRLGTAKVRPRGEILWPCNDDRMRSHISICTSVSRCSLLAGGSSLWNHSFSRQPLGRLCNLSLFSSNGSLTRFDSAFTARIVRMSFHDPWWPLANGSYPATQVTLIAHIQTRF